MLNVLPTNPVETIGVSGSLGVIGLLGVTGSLGVTGVPGLLGLIGVSISTSPFRIGV